MRVTNPKGVVTVTSAPSPEPQSKKEALPDVGTRVFAITKFGVPFIAHLLVLLAKVTVNLTDDPVGTLLPFKSPMVNVKLLLVAVPSITATPEANITVP